MKSARCVVIAALLGSLFFITPAAAASATSKSVAVSGSPKWVDTGMERHRR